MSGGAQWRGVPYLAGFALLALPLPRPPISVPHQCRSYVAESGCSCNGQEGAELPLRSHTGAPGRYHTGAPGSDRGRSGPRWQRDFPAGGIPPGEAAVVTNFP